jgi:hypothetical protein
MSGDQKVVEHIKLIQPIISRMSSSSFTVKGFALTVQALLLGFAYKDSMWQLNVILFITVFMLCLLDMYYLWQERLYRGLYNYVRALSDTDFSMNTNKQKESERYRDTISSVAIWPFYLGLLVINIVSLFLEVL